MRRRWGLSWAERCGTAPALVSGSANPGRSSARAAARLRECSLSAFHLASLAKWVGRAVKFVSHNALSAGQPRRRRFLAEFLNTSFLWQISRYGASCRGPPIGSPEKTTTRQPVFRVFQFLGLPWECRRFSTDIHRCRQMPSPVDTLLACFVRGEGRGMNIKSRGPPQRMRACR